MAKDKSINDSIRYEPFILLFQTLSTNEVTQFENYLEVFTKENNALKLLAYCKEHRKDTDDSCWKKASILKKVFADKKDKSRKLREALNSLNEHLEDFLLFQVAKEDRNRALLLTEVFRRRKLPEQAKVLLKSAIALDEARIWDIWKKIPLGDKSYYENTDSKTDRTVQPLSYTIQKIQELELTLRWKYACENAMRQKLGFKDMDMDGLLPRQEASTPINNKWINLYQKCYGFIQNPTEEGFHEMYQLYNTELELKDEETTCILGFILNVGISLYRKGKESHESQLAQLITHSLEHDVISMTNMTTDVFLTFVAIYCSQGSMHKAEALIQDFKLHQPFHARTIALATSAVCLFKNDFTQALEALRGIKFKSVGNQFFQHIIVICCNFGRLVESLHQLNRKKLIHISNDYTEEEEQDVELQFYEKIDKLSKYLNREIRKIKNSNLQDRYKERIITLLITLRSFTDFSHESESLRTDIANQSDLSAKKVDFAEF